MTNTYDAALRRTNLALLNPEAAVLFSQSYRYDSAARLAQVSAGGATATYGYLANSPLVEKLWFTNNGAWRMTTTRQYDLQNRLTRIASGSAAAPEVSFAYAYNAANQRTALTNADNACWIYSYDALGQVTSGRKYWADGTPVAGQQFEYTFDDIGNRKTARAGGDAFGANLRQAEYFANNLNQYGSNTVPGWVPVLGQANSNATVTLWADNGAHAQTDRKGDYYRGELAVTNHSGPVWLTLTNLAVLRQGTNADIVSSATGRVLVAQSPQAFTHDLDGNLTSNGLWANTWNAENRRVSLESRAGGPPAARAREDWTYLPDGRWIERIVSTNDGNAYHAAATNRFVWDGQVLLAVLDPTNGLALSFTRGLDLSGTVNGAGGAGGLLWVSAGASGSHAAAYDGNGNVMGLVSLANGTESARYEYGPFGETLRQSGPMASVNPLRFSSQYNDDTSGVLKYLFRDYDPVMARWFSRDPLLEAGGIALYALANNDPVDKCDWFGLNPHPEKHHPIPWDNKTWDHSSHPLVEAACVNLRTQQRMVLLEGHAGRHTPSYHAEVRRRLDAAWMSLSDRSKANCLAAFDKVVDGLIRDINSGKLQLYELRPVYVRGILPVSSRARKTVKAISSTRVSVFIQVLTIVPGAVFEAHCIYDRMKQGRSFPEAVQDLMDFYEWLQQQEDTIES